MARERMTMTKICALVIEPEAVPGEVDIATQTLGDLELEETYDVTRVVRSY